MAALIRAERCEASERADERCGANERANEWPIFHRAVSDKFEHHCAMKLGQERIVANCGVSPKLVSIKTTVNKKSSHDEGKTEGSRECNFHSAWFRWFFFSALISLIFLGF